MPEHVLEAERAAARARAAANAARVLEVARTADPSRPDPRELLPATEAELAAMRDTRVGREIGIESAQVSRDGRTTVIVVARRP